MNNNDRALLEKNRKKQSLKSMYFNRYLLVRYVTALFFFSNLYWLISLVLSDSILYVIPLVLILFLLASFAEQVKIYSSPTNNARYTKYCFTALLVTNVICILPVCFSSSFAHLYPFLVNQDKSRILVLTILIFGLLLAAFILRRLDKIRHNDDKHYARIKSYEKVIN
ncbi:hypothetical protein [Bacillus sp. B1-b2]|uniref:hypothetical protein n=1 Tax=Bacillus sp. B1-b2 TaxID=2653201 RepID=UPI001261F360|nr:hypothetical protein [Bacillus sp. B1-b2]KAB7665828.1 hypothetical protein F9279_19450 [Bacillus sp. B1-b2]